MLRHKRILVAVRLVLLALISSLALPDFLKGTLSPALPILLGAYFLTNLAMVLEKRPVFFSQRIQAWLLIFDIFVLVAALAVLDAYRQELFLATFLVVLLASAGQRLSVSIGGFLAVAAFYAWFTLDGKDLPEAEAASRLSVGLPVLLVVAIYVGYVTEAVAGERRQREEMETRLRTELAGMSRFKDLAATVLVEPDVERLFHAVIEGGRSLLNAPFGAVFWLPNGETRCQVIRSGNFPAGRADAWAAEPGGDHPLGRALRANESIRVSEPSAAAEMADMVLAPFADRVSALRGCLVLGWSDLHAPLKAEEEAARLLVQQAALSLENAALYRMLSRTRDLWQAAFQSIPAPVVIVDNSANIIQANPAFLSLGDFDLVTLMGSSFSEVLQGASFPNGRPVAFDNGRAPVFDAARMSIPRLKGEFDVTRGPYAGDNGTGAVWVLLRCGAA